VSKFKVSKDFYYYKEQLAILRSSLRLTKLDDGGESALMADWAAGDRDEETREALLAY